MFDESTGGKFVKNYEPERVSLDALAGDNPSLLEHPRFTDFMLLRVDCPWAAFTMEDMVAMLAKDSPSRTSTAGWTPATGLISVITSQDLSVPVAQLIADTAQHKAPLELLQASLVSNVYSFENAKTVLAQ